MKTQLTVGLMLGALALTPGFAATAEETPAVERLAIETAHTSAEHAAVAGYFRAKAAEARAEARRHRSLASAYTAGKSGSRVPFQRRHRDLAEGLEAMTMDYEAMARMHEEEAASTR